MAMKYIRFILLIIALHDCAFSQQDTIVTKMKKLIRDPEIERYQDTLGVLAPRLKIIKMIFSDLEFDRYGDLVATAWIQTLIKSPIYLWKNDKCAFQGFCFKLLVINSKGDTMKPYQVSLQTLKCGCGCTQFKPHKTSDLLVIHPDRRNESRWDNYSFTAYGLPFRSFPDDLYTIKLIYEYNLPDEIPEVTDEETRKLYLKVLRGRYEAEGYFKVHNKGISYSDK